MGIALETVNPVVFDDPEYCCDNFDAKDYKECFFLLDDTSLCTLFGGENEINEECTRVEKCQQCKDHYNRNKK